jgi:hypothetical protein
MRHVARGSAIATALTVVALIGVGVAAAPAGASGQGNTSPILECVWHDTRTGQYNSLWGYTNGDSSSDSAPIGSNNNFSPTPQNRGQPTSFSSGQHHNVFVVTWNGSGSLTWNVEGSSVSATSGSAKCATNPVPLLPSPFAPWTGAVLLVALLLVGGFFVSRRLETRRTA